jgi:hypothetical protein
MIYDIILPPGRHSWNLDEGWIATLKRRNQLGNVFRPEIKDANAFLMGLRNTKSDVILIMGGDHHLEFLHDTPKKKAIWLNLRTPSVCIGFESILTNRFPRATEKSESACETFSHYTYADEADYEFFKDKKIPSLWLSQCVDEYKFSGGGDRGEGGIFFCGKTGIEKRYEKRTAILDMLGDRLLSPTTEVDAEILAQGYRENLFAINPPGQFRGYNVRTFEALASGCLLFQARENNRQKTNEMFVDGQEIILFDPDSTSDLLNKYEYYLNNRAEALRIANNGQLKCRNEHTIDVRVDSIEKFLIASYEKNTLIQIGCGDNILKGFKNIDCRALRPFVTVDDATKLDSIRNNSADLIYTCHVLEHFPYKETVNVLKSWNSKLSDGGKIFISVPNFRYLAFKYFLGWGIDKILPPLMGGQEYKENFHYVAFDFKNLSRCLKDAGFSEIKIFNPKKYWFTGYDCSRWRLSLNVVAKKQNPRSL